MIDSSVASPAPTSHASAADRDAMRLTIATRDYPLTLLLAGSLLIFFSVLSLFTVEHVVVTAHLMDAVVALTLIGSALVFRWGRVAPARQPWIFAAVGCLFALALLYKVTIDQTPRFLTFVIIIMCALGPCTLAWRPFLLASGVVIAAIVPVTIIWPVGEWRDWLVVAVVATSTSSLLLNARLRGIFALADTNALARQLATTDQLTGLLNRHGFMERLPGLASSADRLGQPIFVVFVDVRGLKLANDRFGHEFGDRVIHAASRAVTKSVRAGDLVARWGGDEIVIVGVGRLPEAEAFDVRLQAQHEWTGDDKEKWSGALSVGFAEGSLTVESIYDIIGRADNDMYRRREVR